MKQLLLPTAASVKLNNLENPISGKQNSMQVMECRKLRFYCRVEGDVLGGEIMPDMVRERKCRTPEVMQEIHVFGGHIGFC